MRQRLLLVTGAGVDGGSSALCSASPVQAIGDNARGACGGSAFAGQVADFCTIFATDMASSPSNSDNSAPRFPLMPSDWRKPSARGGKLRAPARLTLADPPHPPHSHKHHFDHRVDLSQSHGAPRVQLGLDHPGARLDPGNPLLVVHGPALQAALHGETCLRGRGRWVHDCWCQGKFSPRGSLSGKRCSIAERRAKR